MYEQNAGTRTRNNNTQKNLKLSPPLSSPCNSASTTSPPCYRSLQGLQHPFEGEMPFSQPYCRLSYNILYYRRPTFELPNLTIGFPVFYSSILPSWNPQLFLPYFIPFPSHSTYSLSVNLQSFYDLAKAYTKLPSLLSPSTSLTTHFSIRLTGASSSRLARCSAVSGSSSRVSLSLEEKQGTVSDNRANRWQDRGGREEGGTGKERERKKRSFPVSSAGL